MGTVITGPMTTPTTKRIAVVTGGNRGMGLEICRQLASKGVLVVLTARDEKRGIEAVEGLKKSGLSDVIFHELNVTDPASTASLADFIKTHFGKLDILVNNAGVMGSIVTDAEALRAAMAGDGDAEFKRGKWKELTAETYESTEGCVKANYYGVKQVIEALLPLLQLSESPRIVNVSSASGKLEHLPNVWAKGILSNADSLTEERVDEVLNQFLKDFKEGLVETNNWPDLLPGYHVAKAALNAYTRIIAKKFPGMQINCVCPGYVKTEINYNSGELSPEEGAEPSVKLALMPDDGPTGLFFIRFEVSSYD